MHVFFPGESPVGFMRIQRSLEFLGLTKFIAEKGWPVEVFAAKVVVGSGL